MWPLLGPAPRLPGPLSTTLPFRHKARPYLGKAYETRFGKESFSQMKELCSKFWFRILSKQNFAFLFGQANHDRALSTLNGHFKLIKMHIRVKDNKTVSQVLTPSSMAHASSTLPGAVCQDIHGEPPSTLKRHFNGHYNTRTKAHSPEYFATTSQTDLVREFDLMPRRAYQQAPVTRTDVEELSKKGHWGLCKLMAAGPLVWS